MNELLRFEPTPDALRNGRRTMAITAVIGLLLAGLIASDASFTDPNTVAVFAALAATLIGDAIAYLGSPTTIRYRVGLAITTIGIIAGFWFALTRPLPVA